MHLFGLQRELQKIEITSVLENCFLMLHVIGSRCKFMVLLRSCDLIIIILYILQQKLNVLITSIIIFSWKVEDALAQQINQNML